VDDLGGKRREDMRLARAWHGGDSQPPAAIVQDFLLGRAGSKVIHNRESVPILHPAEKF
jgi:hypothetical protein